MDAAKVGSNYSTFSISIDNELMNVIVTSNYNINELYTESLCEEQSKTEFINFTVSSLEGCRPLVGQVVVKLTMHVLECMLH